MGSAERLGPLSDVLVRIAQALLSANEYRPAVASLAVVGMGPVGLGTGVAFAMNGQHVVGLDIDANRVALISEGRTPFFEPDLPEALRDVLDSGRFMVTSETDKAIPGADFVFLCVGTPSRPDGSMEDAFIRDATKDVGESIEKGTKPVVVVKSTVIPGTTGTVVSPILEASGKSASVAVNPEFLREGHALTDSLHPDRVILGVDDLQTAERLKNLYAHLTCPVVETDLRTAESIKYATNAFLATKVAFADEMANICQAMGIAYDEVIEAVTLDPRINPRFLVPGVGFGGSCFPKDVLALVRASQDTGYTPPLLQAVLLQNEIQYLQAVRLLERELGGLKGRRIALLGLAFKGGTDDVRESRAIPIARSLLQKGATVVGYDPVANDNFARIVTDAILAGSLEEALRNADGCILQAEWPEFSRLRAEDFRKNMRSPVVVDGRRILDPAVMKGVRFRRIGST